MTVADDDSENENVLNVRSAGAKAVSYTHLVFANRFGCKTKTNIHKLYDKTNFINVPVGALIGRPT